MSKATRIWLIVAAALVLVGLIIIFGVMTMLHWDWNKLSSDKYETNVSHITQDFKNISIMTDTADVAFMPSEDGRTVVSCYEQTKGKHSVTVNGDTLTVKIANTKKWYDYIGINVGTPSITVYLPQSEYEALTVKSRTGSINVSDMSVGTLDLCVTTGKVTATDIVCEGDVSVSVSTGKTHLTDIKCKKLISDGNTGNITMENVIATESFSIERSTGDVSLDGCDAAEIFITTDTGDVWGSLLSDKVFITHTDTGKVDTPNTTVGGRCEITTDTGDIKIQIKEKTA